MAPPALAVRLWMSEEAMRAEFIGKTRDGHFRTGKTWTSTHLANGRSEFIYDGRTWLGHWTLRGRVFCTFGDPVTLPVLPNGCWSAVKVSANCYEYYVVRPSGAEAAENAWTDSQWFARGRRREEPSTCTETPSV